MKITAAELLLRYLEGEKVEYIFGVPGTSLVPLYDAINKQDFIKPILCKHEEGSAFMADGYARVSRKLGVCYATSGPGATNLVTGVANAYLDNIPLLVITGQVPTSSYGKGTFQDSTKGGIDSVAMFDTMTKFNEMIISRYKVPETLRNAIRIAFSGKKGPVHISFPKDIMQDEVEDTLILPKSYRVESNYYDRKLVVEASQKIINAKNPAMLVGSGVIASDAMMEVFEVAELLNIPVATTPKAKGAFPEDNPLSLGVFGFNGSPAAEKYLTSDLDVLLVVGSSLNQMTTLCWDPNLQPSETLIHINIDPSEIGKNYVADIGLVGDCKTVLNEISFRVLRELENHDFQKERPVENIIKFKEKVGMYIDKEKMFSKDIPLKPQALTREIQENLPDDAIIFMDVGNHLCWTVHYMQFKYPKIIPPYGFMPMGYATAAAIGGKLAAPERPVIAIVGDGCFQMNGMEIATAVNYDIPVIWIVQNNSRLGMVHELQKLELGDKTVSTTFKEVNLAKVAEGLGAKGYRLERPGEISDILPDAIESQVPTVIDVIIDPNEVPPLESWIKGVKEFSSRLDYL